MHGLELLKKWSYFGRSMMVRGLIGITVLIFELLLRKIAHAKHQVTEIFCGVEHFSAKREVEGGDGMRSVG